MDKSITLTTKEQCTGCGACKAKCPKQAISFLPDDEGFPTPKIQEDLCVSCGLCKKVCPAINKPNTNSIKLAYAAQIKDDNALSESTSGGLFTVFAREIFRRGGIVYGCVWDENYNAVIRKAENEDELKPMRGSKYVWSWAGDTFAEIKSLLDKGRTVMFTGFPCQVAGLKTFLQKDYENLFLIDFFCGGSPSPYAFQEYLKTITKDIPLEKLDFKFRDKEKYGVGVHITYNSINGRVHQSYIQNPYFFAYHTKVFYRMTCYSCNYKYEQRVEDITIGDYWRIDDFHDGFNVRAGVSAMLINSDKGNSLLESVMEDLIIVPTDVHNIAKSNRLFLGNVKKTFNIPRFRESFFVELRKNGWISAEKKYLHNKDRIKLYIKSRIPKKIMKKLRKIKGR